MISLFRKRVQSVFMLTIHSAIVWNFFNGFDESFQKEVKEIMNEKRSHCKITHIATTSEQPKYHEKTMGRKASQSAPKPDEA